MRTFSMSSKMPPRPKSLSEQAYKLGRDGLSDAKKSYTNACNAKAIWIIYSMGSSPLWISVLLLNHYYIKKEWLAAIGYFGALGCIIASWWYSKITAYYVNEENMSFVMAFKNTLFSVFVQLAFIPLVGPIFEKALGKDESKH